MKRAHAYSRAYLVWSTCTKHSYNHCELTTGVATGGHGWARAHPTSARVGREICTNSRTFFGGVGWGGFQTRMNLKVHRTYEHIICLCTVSCTFTFEYSDRVYSILQMYRVSKNSPPLGFLIFFLNSWEFLDQILQACYRFIPTIEYNFLFNYLQLC